MIDSILAAMLSLPQWHGDRSDTHEQRAELYRPVAQVIADIAPNRTTAAVLVALGYSESRFARFVLEGRCAQGPRGMRCDADPRTGRPRARGPWQVWSWCRDAWRHPEGSAESLAAEGRCAARMLSGGLRRCQGRHPAGDLAGAFSAYRSASCTWPGAARRVRMVRVVEGKF